MPRLEKAMLILLSLCIAATICTALSLTHVSGSITLAFGKQPDSEYETKIATFAAALPVKSYGGN